MAPILDLRQPGAAPLPTVASQSGPCQMASCLLGSWVSGSHVPHLLSWLTLTLSISQSGHSGDHSLSATVYDPKHKLPILVL